MKLLCHHQTDKGKGDQSEVNTREITENHVPASLEVIHYHALINSDSREHGPATSTISLSPSKINVCRDCLCTSKLRISKECGCVPSSLHSLVTRLYSYADCELVDGQVRVVDWCSNKFAADSFGTLAPQEKPLTRFLSHRYTIIRSSSFMEPLHLYNTKDCDSTPHLAFAPPEEPLQYSAPTGLPLQCRVNTWSNCFSIYTI
ncbi:hypothetical protein TNCV_2579411 [Trichonephila clavipes]|uniref:Uncharacterized protein n=1 Tax=Trichonephila clavipes TaxID=2585209 RepID=A0A8X6VCU7_TRICX|nr:hypothetical protein TNCV_2579411 [Trichonephila clavipes]